MAPRRLRPLLVATAVAMMVAASCGDEAGGDAERFCGEIDENKPLLTDPTLVWSDDVEPLLELYREIADLAPLAIETEWRQLLATYETASTVVPDDQESVQTALAAAYQSEAAAVAVADWLSANCAVELPVETIVPPDPRGDSSPDPSSVPPTDP